MMRNNPLKIVAMSLVKGIDCFNEASCFEARMDE
jgi:hypothetical protein